VHLNLCGSLVEDEWRRLADRFAGVDVDEFIIMPNHLHGILVFVDVDSSCSPGPSHPHASLATLIAAYKSTTARMINTMHRTPGRPVWQRNYYEHIIRNERDWSTIRRYICNNPANWEFDEENR
jgi:putative transposase